MLLLLREVGKAYPLSLSINGSIKEAIDMDAVLNDLIRVC